MKAALAMELGALFAGFYGLAGRQTVFPLTQERRRPHGLHVVIAGRVANARSFPVRHFSGQHPEDGAIYPVYCSAALEDEPVEVEALQRASWSYVRPLLGSGLTVFSRYRRADESGDEAGTPLGIPENRQLETVRCRVDGESAHRLHRSFGSGSGKKVSIAEVRCPLSDIPAEPFRPTSYINARSRVAKLHNRKRRHVR